MDENQPVPETEMEDDEEELSPEEAEARIPPGGRRSGEG